MTVPRLLAIGFIFVAATVAWTALGTSVQMRTQSADADLRARVGGLWGERQTQSAPTISARAGSGRALTLAAESSDISARLELDQRRKGLLWYSTYRVDFEGVYVVSNPTSQPLEVSARLAMPSPDGVYDGFAIETGDGELPVTFVDDGATARFTLGAGARERVRFAYKTSGLDEWSYDPSPGNVGSVRDFTLTMITDFPDVDFPEGSVSPTEKERDGKGWLLRWHYDSLISGRAIALEMPQPLNPGPVAQRISFFAPVSLLFFFAALTLLTATERVRLHPMHYGFLAAGFFAFHLLMAYLADRIDITAAFLIAAVASVALCVLYLRAVIGAGKTLAEIALGQTVFLVLFSYSFFFEGFTGLAITIGSVCTLAVFMAKTAGVDWEQVFAPRRAQMAEQTNVPSLSEPPPVTG